MPRPPMEIGTVGEIWCTKSGAKWRARCRYRHFDGRVYDVERYDVTKGKAVDRLKKAIRDFAPPVAVDRIGPNSRFREVAALWMADVNRLAERGVGSFTTVDTYRSRLGTSVLPELGELRMREVTVKALDDVTQGVRDRMSASSAKTVRAIISGVCGFAVRHGALERNMARDIGRIDSRQAKTQAAKSRALTIDEVTDLLAKLDADAKAVADDLPDLVRFFLGTGERTGEALAAHWEHFDAAGKVIRMQGNVIRATGRGKVLNEGKTANSQRPIPLADWCVVMLVERKAKTGKGSGPIFPSTTGTIREAANIRARAWKPFLERAGFEWVTFRTFRKTVATLLDEAKLTARQIADILGHARPSMTQDVYMGRGSVSRAAAEALEAAMESKARGKRGV